MDVKFREDGEINVETRFAGYPESLGRQGWAGVRYMKSMCDLFGGFRQPADASNSDEANARPVGGGFCSDFPL